MIISGPLLRQYLVVTAVNLCSLSSGLAIGWSSPGLVKLRDANQTTLSRTISEEEGARIVSFACLSSIACTFSSAFLMDCIGRKYTIILAAVLKVAVGVMLTLGSEVWVVVMSKAILGGLDEILFCVIPSYTSEIASKEIRGALGAIFNMFIAFGIVVMLSVGPFCSYLTINVVYTAVTLAAVVPLIFLPESPYFLYAKGHKEECTKILALLRGPDHLVNEEITQYSLVDNGQKVNRWLLFKDRVFLKGMGLSLVFIVGGQLVGHNVIVSYLQTILEMTDTSVKPEVASIVIGCVTATASTCTFLFTDKFGRKPILTVTLCGAAIGLILLGLFFKMKENGYDTSGFFNYMPIISLILFFFCQGAGFSATAFIITSELFDGKSRATGMSVVALAAALILFLSARYFIIIASAIGFPLVFWILSLNSALTCLFVEFFVPETKGKTFAEIQEQLGAKKYVEDQNLKAISNSSDF